MKFDKTDEFAADWKSMPIDHRRVFRSLMPAFNAACEAYLSNPGQPWPATLRVKPLVHSAGIWEMTWSFSGPDGRATFEFFHLDGDTAVRWRRIGRHALACETNAAGELRTRSPADRTPPGSGSERTGSADEQLRRPPTCVR